MKKFKYAFAALMVLAGFVVTTSVMAMVPIHCEQCIAYSDGTVMCINCTIG